MFLLNAESPGWTTTDCPEPKRPLKIDFHRTFDNFALTRLNGIRDLHPNWRH